MSIFPIGQYVSTPGGTAEFTCVGSPSAEVVGVQWLVNGTILEDLNLTNVTTTSLGSGIEKMELANISVKHNKTRVRCTVEFITEGTQTSPSHTLMLLQGWHNVITPANRNLICSDFSYIKALAS